jgi:hypothetical protein
MSISKHRNLVMSLAIFQPWQPQSLRLGFPEISYAFFSHTTPLPVPSSPSKHAGADTVMGADQIKEQRPKASQDHYHTHLTACREKSKEQAQR